MRCNRCGNPLDPRDTYCSVCGRTLPPPRKPRPAPQKSASQKPSDSHIKLPQLDQFTYAYAKDADRSHRIRVLTLLAVIVCLVMTVLMFRNFKALTTAMEDLKTSTAAQIQALQQMPTNPAPTIQDTTEPDPTDAPVQNPQPLSRQRLKAALTLRRTDDRNYAIPTMELGTFDADPTTYVSTQWNSSQSRTEISWVVGTGDQLDLLLEESYDTATSQLAVMAQWAFSGDTFGGYGDVLTTWECRTSKDSEWGAVPANCAQSAANSSVLTITADTMELLLAQYQEMELRCLVSLTHPDGGTMSITVDGVTVGRTGLMSSW